MAFEDVILHWSYKWLDAGVTGMKSLREARQAAASGTYTADLAVNDVVKTLGSFLDLWAGMATPSTTPTAPSATIWMLGQATAINTGVALVGTPIALPTAPSGTLTCTDLDAKAPGGAKIAATHLTPSLSGKVVNVTLKVSGATVSAGLYGGSLNENGTPIVQVVCALV